MNLFPFAVVEYSDDFANIADIWVDPEEAKEMVNRRYGYELDWYETEGGYLAKEEQIAILGFNKKVGWTRPR